MILNLNLTRLMIPPWRSLSLTMRSKELASLMAVRPRPGSEGQVTPELTHCLKRWRQKPDLISAAELVETAIVDAQEEEAINAARVLLAENSQAAPLVQSQAASLLKRVGLGNEVPANLETMPIGLTRLWRKRTRLYPHSPLAWVELGLNYTIQGRLDRAERALLVALQLAPNDRHVLRSASRFFLHCTDDVRAYETIANSEAVQTDPWLIASELALAERIKKSPRFYKRGVAMLDRGMLPRQLTELAGSLATKELLEGNKKKSRRFFRTSMTDPNANALAQAAWASPRFGDALYSVSTLKSVEEAHEARAQYLYREGNFAEVFTECEAWMENEPYSIRPYEFAAVTANVIEDHERSDQITKKGLAMRHNWPQLLNSRVFGLAGQDRLHEAEATLAKFPKDAPQWTHLVADANKGLIAFRQRKYAEGVIYYQKSIDGFQKAGLGNLALSARVYLCREYVRSGLPEGQRMVEALRSTIQSSHDNALKRVFNVAEGLLAARELINPNVDIKQFLPS